MQFKSKLLLTTIISASFLACPAAANASTSATLSAAYSDNTYSTQTILAQLGYVQPAQVNGYMDQATRDAVSQFQQANGLPANGMIDPKTAEILNNSYASAPAQLAPAPAPKIAPTPAKIYSSNSMAIQQILYKLGYFRATPNGYMDEKTIEAIINFQKAAGLPASGEIDQATATRLNEAYKSGGLTAEEIAFAKEANELETSFGPALLAPTSLLWTDRKSVV